MSKVNMEGQKRALEALKRRFAEAKAELQTAEQKNERKTFKRKKEGAEEVGCSSIDPTVKKVSNSSFGHISFVGYTSGKDEHKELAYLRLSHAVCKELLPAGVEVADQKIAVTCVLHHLLQHGDSAEKYIQGSKSMKIENTILLDNYVKKASMFGDPSLQSPQDWSKRSKKHLSRKEHKKLGSFDLPGEFHKFAIFKPMHDKWKSHISQLVKNFGKDQLPLCFLNADLHGAVILVVDCKIAAYVGTHGIMIRETKETFGIITQEDKFRVVPKKLSVFSLQAGCWKITLLGDRLSARNLAA